MRTRVLTAVLALLATVEASGQTQAPTDPNQGSPPSNDPYKWARELTNLKDGGWSIESESPEVVGLRTAKGAKRDGNVATIWSRFEYRDTKHESGVAYKSIVVQEQFDCVARTSRAIASVTYTENDLRGESQTFTAPANTPWNPIVPGTRGEDELTWACRVTAPKQTPHGVVRK